MKGMLDDFRIFEPYPGIFAYYDGRIAGKRLYSEGPNWLDDGAFSLGIASYAIVDGNEALVYDTHISLDHARAIRAHLEARDISKITVVLSHFHNDHIAGNEVFADCIIVANGATARLLEAEKPRIDRCERNLLERRIEVYSDPTGDDPEPAFRQRKDYDPASDVPLVIDPASVAQLAVRSLLP